MLPFPRKRLVFALVFFCCAVFAMAKLGPEADPNAAGPALISTPTATATSTPSNATVQFSSATYNTNETETAVITITRTGDISGTNTVFFTISDGTATGGSSCTSGIDYVRSGQPIDFGPGQASMTVNIPICPDAITEPDETVDVGLYAFNTTIGTPSFAVLTIHDQATPTNTPTATASPVCTPGVLYDQTDNPGTGGSNSQDFEEVFDAFDDRNADDFVVPAGQTWTVQKVVAYGLSYNGLGTVESFNVTFYHDEANLPGAAADGGTITEATYTNADGVFTINLPTDVVLAAGTYWVAIQARLDYMP